MKVTNLIIRIFIFIWIALFLVIKAIINSFLLRKFIETADSFGKYLKNKKVSKYSFNIVLISVVGYLLNIVSIYWFIFIISICGSILITAYLYTPIQILHFLTKELIKLIYDLDVKGIENIPEQGGGVLICNHVSYVDFAIIATILNRHARFVLDNGIYNFPFVKSICDIGNSIPIDTYKNRQVTEKAFSEIKNALDNNQLVVFFPEGQITYDGQIKYFKRGLERIQKENNTIIIPMSIQGLSKSYFGRVGTAFKFEKLKQEFKRKVKVRISKPVESNKKTLQELERIVKQMFEQE